MTIAPFVSAKTPGQVHYEAYLHSFRWRAIVRPLRLWIDGYRCRVCDCPGEYGNPLNVHHTPTAYRYKGRSNGSPLDLLLRTPDIIGEVLHTITLCQKHHHKIHEV